MQFKTIASLSAVLVVLCTLIMNGCGVDTPESADPGSEFPHEGEEVGGEPSSPSEGWPSLPSSPSSESGPSSPSEGDGTPRQDAVTLCHVPPGNPANAHTITVGAPAVKAHLRHGDHLGACDGSSEPDAGTTPPPPPADGGSTQPDGGSTQPDGGSTEPPDGGPVCAGPNQACSSAVPCCSGLVCQAGSCVPDLD